MPRKSESQINNEQFVRIQCPMSYFVFQQKSVFFPGALPPRRFKSRGRNSGGMDAGWRGGAQQAGKGEEQTWDGLGSARSLTENKNARPGTEALLPPISLSPPKCVGLASQPGPDPYNSRGAVQRAPGGRTWTPAHPRSQAGRFT